LRHVVDSPARELVPIVISIASVALIISSFVSALRTLSRMGGGGRVASHQPRREGRRHTEGAF
jgi:hypothetical protein